MTELPVINDIEQADASLAAVKAQLPTELPVINDIEQPAASLAALKAQLPTELTCPVIPGFSFPHLPDLKEFGEIADNALHEVGDLVNRVANPPSAADIHKEFSRLFSSKDEKANSAFKAAAAVLKAKAEDEAIRAKDAFIATATAELQALEAVVSGAVSLALDIAMVPIDVLGAAFNGFKQALDCAKGAFGESERESRDRSPLPDEGLEDGVGVSAPKVIADKTQEPVTVPRKTVGQKDEFTIGGAGVTREQRETETAKERADYQAQKDEAASQFEREMTARKAQEKREKEIRANRDEEFAAAADAKAARTQELYEQGVRSKYHGQIAYDQGPEGKGYIIESEDVVTVVDPITKVVLEIITVQEMVARGVNLSERPSPVIMRDTDAEYNVKQGESL